MNENERQTFAFLSLFGGQVVLTALWIGLYAYHYHFAHEHKGLSPDLVEEGQAIVWKLMAILAITTALIAIGGIVSARVGDFFDIKREVGKE